MGFPASLVWGRRKQPFRVASRDFVAFFSYVAKKSNINDLFFLFWLPFGNHTCFKSNLFGRLLLISLPFPLQCGVKSNLNCLFFLFWLPFLLLYLKLFQPFTLYIVTKNSQKVKYSFLIFAITFIYTSFLFYSFVV